MTPTSTDALKTNLGQAGAHLKTAAADAGDAVRNAGEELRADICQIGHHGRTSSKDDAIYRAVEPKVALWPSCYEHIDLFRIVYKTNQWIFGEDSTIVDHFVATDGHQALTLPYEPKGLPYNSEGRYPPENLYK